jgi:hypothetical protein
MDDTVIQTQALGPLITKTNTQRENKHATAS